MQVTQVIDKKLTKPISKIFIGIILISFVLLTVLWLPQLINNWGKKEIPKISEENLSINSESATSVFDTEKQSDIDYNQMSPVEDGGVMDNSFAPKSIYNNFKEKDEFKAIQGDKLETKGVTIQEKNDAGDPKEKTDFKELITWFIGSINSVLIMLLTIKKIFGKGV